MRSIINNGKLMAMALLVGLTIISCSGDGDDDDDDAPELTLTDFTPKTGSAGTEVTITGTGFGTDESAATIEFNGTAVTEIVSYSATQIVVEVPDGATTGAISVTVGDDSEEFEEDFTVNVAGPVDMTDEIENPSFEANIDDLATGWTYENGADTLIWHVINTDGDSTKDGDNICGLWHPTFRDEAITQTITGLPNGTYMVTADLMCAANTASNRLTTQRIFANNNSVLYGMESDYTAATIAVLTDDLDEEITYAGHEVTTTAENGPFLTCEVTTTVTDGTLKLGIKTNGSDSEHAFEFPHLTAGDGWGWFKVDNFTLTYLGE